MNEVYFDHPPLVRAGRAANALGFFGTLLLLFGGIGGLVIWHVICTCVYPDRIPFISSLFQNNRAGSVVLQILFLIVPFFLWRGLDVLLGWLLRLDQKTRDTAQAFFEREAVFEGRVTRHKFALYAGHLSSKTHFEGQTHTAEVALKFDYHKGPKMTMTVSQKLGF
ncbi:hypothetical protein [Deinococcus cellulosilyticus]|uniref:Uncharacterized protein n=1 Tax=Deinococcus cellulosilyticus (strain DSM 18568 / NBRC 106333 / KACC 11606 / 5516J-15) TaxID=1223518 RepID=A0A511N225_DEIC1|nr:hypothetical protein [Deinococcus cellulosilyticus]GEM46518.1 hypothetical protein DC3_21530 [Deinococcus cellulosilyticus NBRC 106333 = KACC 11606]